MRYISPEAVKHLYLLQNNAFQKIYASHLRQHESLNKLKNVIKEGVYAFREDLAHLDYYRFKLIISLGGDNHFIHVSHYTTDQFIFGMNSDERTSVGALLQFDAPSFLERFDPTRTRHTFHTEEWSRIDCELIYPDGRRTHTGPCTSEISVRNSFPDTMSRYLLRRNEEEWEEQKSSGLLLATGAGSTGWYRNCLPEALRREAVFPKVEPSFRIVAREPGYNKNYRYRTASMGREDVLELVSEMEGEISIDANPDRTFDFPSGCRARFTVSRDTLRVVTDISYPD